MKAAGQVFKLAVGLNFIQGRRTKTVAAVCLYIACRRQDGNTVMLIDLADVLMVSSHDFFCLASLLHHWNVTNVFVYRSMCLSWDERTRPCWMNYVLVATSSS